MRESIVEYVKRELIGPDPLRPYIQENGEEILKSTPLERYITAILYPQNYTTDNDLDNPEVKPEDKDFSDLTSVNPIGDFKDSSFVPDDSEDDPTILTNSFLPSALGFSCILQIPDKGLHINISAGRYLKKKFTPTQEDHSLEAYFREQIRETIVVKKENLQPNKSVNIFKIQKGTEDIGLELRIIRRASMFEKTKDIFTFTLVNTLLNNKSYTPSELCFFQIAFSVESVEKTTCFLPYPENPPGEDEDSLNNALLYRHKKTFAVGHGCSPMWDDNAVNSTNKISAEIMPTYEIKTIVPKSLSTKLEMYLFGHSKGSKDYILVLENLCTEYKTWLNSQEKEAKETLTSSNLERALLNIENGKLCLERMVSGVKCIEENKLSEKAFSLMNQAMILQQLHYRIPLRKWSYKNNKRTLSTYDIPADIQKWADQEKVGNWYPFQLAFILLNIRSIIDPSCKEREIVDLIWFPTGGGKTEAYLGLTAFTIFYRRLTNADDEGVSVIMRYTLRLLTNQQFQRASSLICACEKIRDENTDILGSKRISIGLWVGNDLTPNKRSIALSKLKELTQGNNSGNAFLLQKCPWCGALMGPTNINGKEEVIGYHRRLNPSTVYFLCENDACEYSQRNIGLPLLVIDEDMYDKPPTLLIGTVDKFAMLVWKPKEIRRLFGYRDGASVKPPDLIIQDELHLISGPLGTIVGHYELLIDELCSIELGNKKISPKIVASTATLSKAREQINALYGKGRENVLIFPPPILKAGDSFFASENKEMPGRLYVGINAPGKSHPTAHVRTIASLIQGVHEIEATKEVKNYYWTILDYFNSLRELGHAVTRVQADIQEYFNYIWQRKNISSKNNRELRRFIKKAIELTSRIESSKISQYLSELEIEYSEANNLPIDICMATNMISVGVDVPRLGLMTVTGQPKTTSEYIQTTSRVGRSSKGPGLVFVIYNPTKPRDRSHYEKFFSYHNKIYSYVEPTSVTPFSKPVADRLLHAILIGFIRFFGTNENLETPQSDIDKKLIDKIHDIYKKRVKAVNVNDELYVLKLLDRRIEQWKRLKPPAYGSMMPNWQQDTLIYPNNLHPPEDFGNRSWPTPTSMRNVDATCEGYVLADYQVEKGDEL